MSIAIQPAKFPQETYSLVESATWEGIDGAIYDATLHFHPISNLAYYVVTRDGEECGAILADALRRTIYKGFKLPFPVPAGVTNSAPTITRYDGARVPAEPPTPRVSQFRAMKEQLQQRKQVAQ